MTDSRVTVPYAKRAVIWLVITTTIYLILNGAQIFETAVIVPNWTAGPPESLFFFQGKYALDFKAFWIVFHSLHELTFIAAIIFCWRVKPVRNWLLALLVLHIAVRVWTVAYFAPTIIEFQQLTPASGVDPALVAKAGTWELLNYIRVAIFIAISLAFIPLIRKTALAAEQA